MRRHGSRWTVRLSAAAETDFASIIRWTAENFGVRQAREYAITISLAVEALASGPHVSGAKRRDDIGKEIYTLHVARAGRRGRHFVLFRVERRGGSHVIDVLRLLHDAMDLPRHSPAGEGE